MKMNPFRISLFLAVVAFLCPAKSLADEPTAKTTLSNDVASVGDVVELKVSINAGMAKADGQQYRSTVFRFPIRASSAP